MENGNKRRVLGGLLIVLFLFGIIAARAQHPAHTETKYAYFKGQLTKAVPAEVSVIAKYKSGQSLLVSYTTSTKDSIFSFAVPAVDSASYILRFTTMKQGHVRLEKDKDYDFLLSVQPGTTVDVRIDPSLAKKESKDAVSFSTSSGLKPTARVSVRLSSSKYVSAYSLARVRQGRLEEVENTRPLPGDSVMQFLLPVDRPGFYYLTMTGWKRRVYLKPGDQLEFNMDWRTKELTWVKSTKENDQLFKWDRLLMPVTSYGYNKKLIFVKAKIGMDAFMAAYKKVLGEAGIFSAENRTDDPEFNDLFKVLQQTDLELSALNYLFFYRSKKLVSFLNTDWEYTSIPSYFIQQITSNKVTDDEALFQLGEGALYVNRYGKFALALMDEPKKTALDKAARLNTMLRFLPGDRQKASFLLDALGEVEVNNLSEFNSIFKAQQKYAQGSIAAEKYSRVFEQFAGDTVYIGKPVGDLVLTDVNGKKVNLNSFKGKVVFIDTWATWCGPCKEQVPYLKDVEAAYKGNEDIVFIGISIDRKEEEEKWKKMIKTLDLHGLQLIDYHGVGFAKPYQITSIPRFLLLDKQGKWIEVRCPKPANKKELMVYIDKALR